MLVRKTGAEAAAERWESEAVAHRDLEEERSLFRSTKPSTLTVREEGVVGVGLVP